MNERLKQIRTQNNMTQQSFADKLGVPRSNIAGYEKGIRTPSDAAIALICREFHINETWLRTGIGDMTAETTHHEKLAGFFAEVLASAPDDRSTFIAALADLPPEFWPLVVELARNIAAGFKNFEPPQISSN